MKTLVLREGVMPDIIAECVNVLRKGNLIVYPTDTVYGLGADATNTYAVQKLRATKGRDESKPILAMVDGPAMLRAYAHVTPLAQTLIDTFLPGPLALILDTRTDALSAIAGPDGEVGFRIPRHPLCNALVAHLQRPITSTSVNRSGIPQPHTLDEMPASLVTRAHVQCVLDAGTLPSGTPSTVVDVRGDTPHVLREGAVPAAHVYGCVQ